MKKRIVPASPKGIPLHREQWVDIENIVTLEVTSEDPAHPIEAALLPGCGGGWKAADPGVQSIRIIFDDPRDLSLIHLVFTEEHRSRTQEIALSWSPTDNGPMRQILRQQYNFEPVSSEVEDYAVNLAGVKFIDLGINPAIGDASAFAELTELRLR